MKIVKFNGYVNEWSVMLFEYQLAQLNDTDDIEIKVDSGGGGIFLGMRMHNILADWKGKTRCVITGLAASMGSVFPLACDEVVMMKGTSLMIHDPSCLTVGNIRDHKQNLQALEVQKENIISIYRDALNKTDEELADIMENETWYTAQQAVEIGFASEVINKKVPKKLDTNDQEASYMTSMVACLEDYNNVPDDVKSLYGIDKEDETDNNNTLEDSMPMSKDEQKEMDDLKAKVLENSKTIGGLESEKSTLQDKVEEASGLQAAMDAMKITNEEISAKNEVLENKVSTLEGEKLENESKADFTAKYPHLIDEDGSQLKALMDAKSIGNESIVAVIENSYKQLNAARDPETNVMLNELGAKGDDSKKISELSQSEYEAKISATMIDQKVDRMRAMEILDTVVEA